jgi:acetyl esterase/lipase
MRTTGLLIGVSTFLALRGAPAPAQERPLEVPPGVKVVRDVEYGRGGGRGLRLHLVQPADISNTPRPLIVWVHGGAWMAGSKEEGVRRLAPYVRRGYVGATIEYRLSGEAIFPAQIEDCKAAIRFLRANAAEYGIDPDRIGVWGSSAGGHLVALLGTTGDVPPLVGQGGHPEESSRVQAVCDFFGPTDFLAMIGPPSRIDHASPNAPEARLLGGPITERKEAVAQANPITYITPDDPPFLILHGDQDDVVPINQSELLAEALKKAGVEVTYHVVAGAGHGFGGPEIDAMVTAFFDKHLKASP